MPVGLHEKLAFGTMHLCILENGFMRDASNELRQVNKIDESSCTKESWT
jgi:hypothetical protein